MKTNFNIGVPIECNDEIDFPDVSITIYLSRLLNEEEEKHIENIISAWYSDESSMKRRNCKLHYLGDIIFDDEQTIYIVLDMGMCPPIILEELLIMIKDALVEFNVEMIKIEMM